MSPWTAMFWAGFAAGVGVMVILGLWIGYIYTRDPWQDR